MRARVVCVRSFRSAAFLCLLLIVLISLSASGLSASDERIIRLSYLQGNVQAQLPAASPEPAILNMPVTEGMRLMGAEDAQAEVEFENGSTLRIAGGGAISFPQLALATSGGKLSTVAVESGFAYFDISLSHDDSFAVLAGGQQFEVTRPSHFRVEVEGNQAQIAMFQGKLYFLSNSGPKSVRKGHTLTVAADNPGNYSLTHRISEAAFDAFDQQRQQERVQLARQQSEQYAIYSGTAYTDLTSYDLADLTSYGAFQNIPAYGYLWQPIGIGPNWNPFWNGAWCYYPTFGWTFIGAYPWGWLPYHFGNWIFIPGRGWFWGAGSPLIPWRPVVRVTTPNSSFVPAPPAGALGTLVVRNGTVLPPLRTSPVAGLPHNGFLPRDTALPGAGERTLPGLAKPPFTFNANTTNPATPHVRVNPTAPFTHNSATDTGGVLPRPSAIQPSAGNRPAGESVTPTYGYVHGNNIRGGYAPHARIAPVTPQMPPIRSTPMPQPQIRTAPVHQFSPGISHPAGAGGFSGNMGTGGRMGR